MLGFLRLVSFKGHLMWGRGLRRKCSECGHLLDGSLIDPQRRELRGPREITSSNIDCVLDDGGRRFLFIEFKRRDEPMSYGQERLLKALARLNEVTVWVVRGTSSRLDASVWDGDEVRVFLRHRGFGDLQKAVFRWFAELTTKEVGKWQNVAEQSPT